VRISKPAKLYAHKAVLAKDSVGTPISEGDIAEAFEAGIRFERAMQRATEPSSPAKASYQREGVE